MVDSDMRQDSAARRALEFVRSVTLPDPPGGKLRGIAGTPPVTQQGLDQGLSQALVVGSTVVSFVAGVTEEARADIINGSLLAQLAAKKKAPNPDDIQAWYEAYFDTLSHLGWVIQEKGFAEYKEKGENFEAHEAVIKLAGVLLGPGATALAVVTATLEAMKAASTGPWLTVFKRESQSARAARFQVTLVEPGAQNEFMVALMAFDLRAKTALTQVLFFRHRKSQATLRHASSRVTINAAVLASIRPVIAEKIAAYTADYIRALDI